MKTLISTVLLLAALPALAGIHVPNLWRKNEVSVCFAPGEQDPRNLVLVSAQLRDWSDKNKQKVRRWVEEEFTPARTGIHFTGWEDCERATYAEVVIWNSRQSPLRLLTGGTRGLAWAGENAPGFIPGYPAAKGKVWLGSTGLNRAVTTHEFGHVAGLMHEHSHPDAAAHRRRCMVKADDFSSRPNLVYTPFDPESVMSYCNTGVFGNRGLSEGDARLLRRLYP